jgi:hypothetical protein
MNNSHNFLTLNDLTTFIESVTPHDIPYDNNTFTSYHTTPMDIDNDLLYQLADIIDKKMSFDYKPFTTQSFKAPNTVERLLNSEYIIYILEEGLPVAVATLIDASKENFMGIIPIDFYSLKSAYNLSGRMQQEFFTIVDEKRDMGLAGELRKYLDKLSPQSFIIVSSTDIDTLKGIEKNNYEFIAEFNTSWDKTSVQLWIN